MRSQNIDKCICILTEFKFYVMQKSSFQMFINEYWKKSKYFYLRETKLYALHKFTFLPVVIYFCIFFTVTKIVDRTKCLKYIVNKSTKFFCRNKHKNMGTFVKQTYCKQVNNNTGLHFLFSSAKFLFIFLREYVQNFVFVVLKRICRRNSCCFWFQRALGMIFIVAHDLLVTAHNGIYFLNPTFH